MIKPIKKLYIEFLLYISRSTKSSFLFFQKEIKRAFIMKVNRQFVIDVLAQDFTYRLTDTAPAVTFDEMLAIRSKFSFSHRFTQEVECEADVLMIKADDRLQIEEKESLVIDKINVAYPLFKEITSMGSWIAAGGDIAKSIRCGGFIRSDLDLFYIGTDGEESVRKICTYLLEKYPNKIVISRNLNVTTLFHYVDYRGDDNSNINAFDAMQFGHKYQFIHRCFPDTMSTIRGFDLGSSMVLYDGDRILFTPFGAICNALGINILNLSRASPSLGFRLKKYYRKYGYSIVVGNVTYSDIKKAAIIQGSINSNVRIGGNLTVKISSQSSKSVTLKGFRITKDSEKSVYDAGDTSKTHSVIITNGIVAVRGRVDCITWFGQTIKSVFDEPKPCIEIPMIFTDPLPYKEQIEFNEHFKVAEHSNYSTYNDITMFSYPSDLAIQRLSYDDKIIAAGLEEKELSQFFGEIGRKVLKDVIHLKSTLPNVRWVKQEDNPGRQWTAAFNRGFEVTPSEWYNLDLCEPIKVEAIPISLLTILVKSFQMKLGSFIHLNRNTFNMLLSELASQYAQDLTDKLVSNEDSD